MTSIRENGEISYECDTQHCNHVLDTFTDNWDVAFDRLHRAGWVESSFAGHLYHYCKECVDEDDIGIAY